MMLNLGPQCVQVIKGYKKRGFFSSKNSFLHSLQSAKSLSIGVVFAFCKEVPMLKWV